MSDESINSPVAFDDSLATSLNYFGAKIRVKFDGSSLKQDKITFNHRNIVNIYIAYEITLWPFRGDDGFTLANALLGAVRQTKKSDKDKYK